MKGFSLDSELIYVNSKFLNKEELFRKVSDDLKRLGFVDSGFYGAIVKRENEFPTGIESPYVRIAIPHANSNHVINPTMAIITSEEGIAFNNMIECEKKVECNIVLVLALKESEEHIRVLKTIMEVIQNEKFAARIKKARSVSEVLEIFNFSIGKELL